MKKNRVLLLGSTGILGSQSYWNDYGFEIIRHGRKDLGSVDYVANLDSIKEAKNMIHEIRPEVVINLAALTNVDQCEELNAAFLANVLTVHNLSLAIQSTKIKIFLIHISTDHIYDSFGFSSEDQINLVNQYASSKLAGELSIQSIDHCILRTNFFCKSNIKKQSITDWLFEALRKKSKINLFNDVMFNPISSQTLIRNIFKVMSLRLLGTFNIGASSAMSKADFALKFASCLNLSFENPNIISVDQVNKNGAKRPKDMRMDISKYERAIGQKLQTLDIEIEEFVRKNY